MASELEDLAAGLAFELEVVEADELEVCFEVETAVAVDFVPDTEG